ncbi:colorectal mutant cancer protein-like isoform X2 [Xenia sp. Carnegie-2017]|uniref:colorectal mutant cancer protein-like isoform X2 n=1 Tax=Xenia sp. Carnegie-2017 TaxID=2897299 RepID=UPI001F04FBDC|nr:colorectal mutant cancer protein-like isoform X2 [Xenia sp. Carnegie-2017]
MQFNDQANDKLFDKNCQHVSNSGENISVNERKESSLNHSKNSKSIGEKSLTRDDATIICREKEELLREFPQSKDDKSVGSCSNEENLRDTSDIRNDVSTTDISNTSSTQTNNISRGTNFLELANTLHFAALASLKSEINDLTKQVKTVTSERDSCRRALKETRDEKDRLCNTYEERLHEQDQQITELQSVIAELRRKLDQTSVNCIAEEDEEEEGTHSSDGDGDSSNASQGGSDPEDTDTAEVFELNEQRATDSDHIDDAHFNTLSKTNQKLQTLGQSASSPVNDKANDVKQLELSRAIFLQLQKKLTELKDQCQELEKRKHQIEKQIQQASVVDYVNRKASGEGGQEQMLNMSREREAMKSQIMKLEQDLERSKTLVTSLREERDNWRKKYQEWSKHHSMLNGSRQEISDPSPPRACRSNSNSAFTPVNSQSQQNVSPRVQRQNNSSTPNSPGSQRHSLNRSWTLGESPGSSLKSIKNSPPGSVKSGQGSWKKVSSDLGSSVHSCPDAVLMSRRGNEEDNELSEGLTGEKLIKILHQLPEFDKMPESLVNTLQSCQTLRDVFHALHTHWTQQSCEQVHEYQIEAERLQAKLEHVRAQNNVIALSMDESKNNSEQLSLLIGKYESQCLALQVELDLCDRTIDAYEAFVYLLESEHEVLNVNCNADGIDLYRYRSLSRGGSESRLRCPDIYEDDDDRMASGCYERRRHAESQARALLTRYDKGSDGNVSTGANRPWEELSSLSRTSATSSTGSSADLDFGKEEEGRLRAYLSRLKDERDTVRGTLMELQSVHDILSPVARIELDTLDAKLDLENAVLLQELMALKEEKAELRAKVYLTEKEKKAVELQLTSREAQEQAYVVHIEHLKTELKDQIRKRRKVEETARAIRGSQSTDGELSNASATPAITLAELRTSDEDIPADLYEAARREKKLKSRIRELVDTLEKQSKSTESRHQQTGEYISDLKRANGALVAAYEKAKKKHTTRVKKLESQMMTMMEKHEKQISSLRERIAMQEDTGMTHPNETAL